MNNDYGDIVSAEDLADDVYRIILTDKEKLANEIRFYEHLIKKTKKRLLRKMTCLNSKLRRERVVRLVEKLDTLETKIRAAKNDFFCAAKGYGDKDGV